ncbi:smf Mn2+ and Fe2+ transporter [Dentipellis sp. KUC8613]|nr:smf Mn2+ and Fe2+ transporter [Dentipellis sp. KUC8613]
MSSVQPSDGSPSTSSNRWTVRFKATVKVVVDHAVKHTGVGIVCAVAYFDPGNWGVDLQAGSQFGYKLLFIVLLSGLFAVFLQSLASKLGIVTGLDLASHCRLLLYNRPKHTRLFRWLALYPLYALSEIAIISTDLAELLGSAIALNLLFPKLPLWAGVLLTASDVLLILALEDPLGGRPVKMFELIIAALVIAVLICMCIIISRVSVNWGDAFDGYVPSKTIFEHGGLYTSVGILGATVMPHSLFLGSALATQDRVSPRSAKPLAQSSDSIDSMSTATISRWHTTPRDWWRSFVSNFRVAPLDPTAEPKSHADRENNSLSFVKAHLGHGIADIVISLLGFAVLINSLILILASAVFYYGQDGEDGSHATASLFDAYDLIGSVVGRGAAITFALALLCAGQSSSIIATVAGQTVSEGFLRWRVPPILRRFFTRLLGLIPSMTVAIIVGKAGIDTMLVASQVVLSIVLPFIVFPLVWLTSSKSIMRVRKPRPEEIQVQVKDDDTTSPASTPGQSSVDIRREDTDLEQAEDEMVDFSNGRIVAAIGYAIWLIVVIANGYVLISLMLGEGS